MYHLDWLHRLFENLEDNLYGKCALVDKLINDGVLNIKLDESEKHPKIMISLDVKELHNELPVLVIHFDPFNQEFYLKSHDEQENEIRTILKDVDHIYNKIHYAIHKRFEGSIQDSIEPAAEEASEEFGPTKELFQDIFGEFFHALEKLVKHPDDEPGREYENPLQRTKRDK